MAATDTRAKLLTYFKTGIMAWDGLLAFWLAAVLFFFATSTCG